MAEQLNLEEIQNTIEEPKTAFDNLQKLQEQGVGQDFTPFRLKQLNPALLNLPPEFSDFYNISKTNHLELEQMLQGIKIAGYKDGVIPIGFKDPQFDYSKMSMEDKISALYAIQTGQIENVLPAENKEKKDNLRQQGTVYYFTDGKTRKLDGLEKRTVVKDIFGSILPFVDSEADKLRKANFIAELEELGLDNETRDIAVKGLEQAFYYPDATGKIVKHEQSKDLSYLIPTNKDVSIRAQYEQILGRLTSDFPSVITGLGIAGIEKGATIVSQPDKRLISEFIFNKGKQTTKIKTPEQFAEDVETYIRQKEEQLEFLQSVTESFDELQNTSILFMPGKEVYKNIIFNNTGLEIDGKLLDELSLQNPTDSIIFHSLDTAVESLPYVLTIQSVLAGFGLKGTKLADEALDYSLKNSGPGLKYATPVHAVNGFFAQKQAKELTGKRLDSFVKKMMVQYNKRLATKTGVTKLKVDLQKEITNINDRIKKVKNSSNPNLNLLETLEKGKNTLIARELGYKTNYLTPTEKSLIRNEFVASVWGGFGDYYFGVNSGAAVAMEFGGAVVEPYFLKEGFSPYLNRAILAGGAMINMSNKIFRNDFLDDVATMSKQKYLNVNFDDIKIMGEDGLPRLMTSKEVLGVKQFTDLLIELPPQRRAEVIGRMSAIDEGIEEITKGLTQEEKQKIKLSFGQLTGLSALQAIDDMLGVRIQQGDLTTDMLIQGNDYVNTMTTLLNQIDNTIADLIDKPNQKAAYTDYITKIKETVVETNKQVQQRNQEILDAFDSVVNFTKVANLFDGTDVYNENITKFVKDLNNLADNGSTQEIRNKALETVKTLDSKIIENLDNVSKGFTFDGSNYNANYLPGMIDAFYISYKTAASNKYDALFKKYPDFKLNFTEYFENLIGRQVVRAERFKQLKEPLSKFTDELPSSYETSEFVDVIVEAVDRNTLDFISKKENHKLIKEYFDSYETVPMDVSSVLNLGEDLSKENTLNVFTAIKRNLIQNEGAYKNLSPKLLNGIDVRDALGGDIPLLLNLEEAMKFRSAFGSFQFAESGPAARFYKQNFAKIDSQIDDNINRFGDVQLGLMYNDAINTYAEFSNRFNNFKLLNDWTQYKTNTSYKQSVQDKSGATTIISKRVYPKNKYATEIVSQFDGTVEEIPTMLHKNEVAIDTKKLLSDKNYANNFIKEFVVPLAGKRNLTGEVAQFDQFILDPNDPMTIKKLEIISRYISEEVGQYIRNSEVGKLVQGKNYVKAIEEKNPETKLQKYKITLFDDIENTFKIKVGDETVDLLKIDELINLNISIDHLILRNTTVNKIATADQITFASNLKKNKQIELQKVKDFNLNLKMFEDESLIINFGEKLHRPKDFSSIIIESGDLQNISRLENILVNSGKMTKQRFDEVTKHLFAEYFYSTFSKPVAKVRTITDSGQATATIDNVHKFDSVSAREYLNLHETNVKKIIGNESYDNLRKILDLQDLSAGTDTTNITAIPLPQSLSLESLMSRIYAINRGVISPRYVAGEIALRRFNKNRGVLIKAVIQNPAMADVVRKILETQDIYNNPALNRKLATLLNQGTASAIFTREVLKTGEEELEDYQTEFLSNLNLSLESYND